MSLDSKPLIHACFFLLLFEIILKGRFLNSSILFRGRNPDAPKGVARRLEGGVEKKALTGKRLNPAMVKHPQEHSQGRIRVAHGLQGYLEMMLQSSFPEVVRLPAAQSHFTILGL